MQTLEKVHDEEGFGGFSVWCKIVKTFTRQIVELAF